MVTVPRLQRIAFRGRTRPGTPADQDFFQRAAFPRQPPALISWILRCRIELIGSRLQSSQGWSDINPLFFARPEFNRIFYAVARDVIVEFFSARFQRQLFLPGLSA
jgi:hypothetical protein